MAKNSAYRQKPNGKKPAVAASKTQTTRGETSHLTKWNTCAANGKVRGAFDRGSRTATVCSILAITFASGAWTGTVKTITLHRPNEIQPVRNPARAAFRAAGPGVIRSRLRVPHIAAAFHPAINTRITVS